jgi:hypothetical protein
MGTMLQSCGGGMYKFPQRAHGSMLAPLFPVVTDLTPSVSASLHQLKG